MGRKKRTRRARKDEEINPFNAAIVMGGLLAAGIYIIMKGCETYESSQMPSPLEQKIELVEKPERKELSQVLEFFEYDVCEQQHDYCSCDNVPHSCLESCVYAFEQAPAYEGSSEPQELVHD